LPIYAILPTKLHGESPIFVDETDKTTLLRTLSLVNLGAILENQAVNKHSKQTHILFFISPTLYLSDFFR